MDAAISRTLRGEGRRSLMVPSLSTQTSPKPRGRSRARAGDRSAGSLVQTSWRTGTPVGVFSKRSPHRPNPIGLSRVKLLAIDNGHLEVGGLDCIDGTVLLDIKPAIA